MYEVQSESQLICILGKRGSGKSTLAVKLVYDEKVNYGTRIVSNMHLNIEYEYMSFADIVKLPKSLINANIIMDEVFIGAGSRRALSKTNIKMTEFVTQIRKRNCNVIIIAQKARLIDVNIRDQVDIIVEMTKITEGFFGAVVRDRDNWDSKTNIIHEFIFDAREFFELKVFDTNEVISFGEEDDDVTKETLPLMNMKALNELAGRKGLTRYAHLRKADLIKLLEKEV